MFFFDVFLALAIIFWASRLNESLFGRATMTFGFVMVVLVTLLRIFRKW